MIKKIPKQQHCNFFSVELQLSEFLTVSKSQWYLLLMIRYVKNVYYHLLSSEEKFSNLFQFFFNRENRMIERFVANATIQIMNTLKRMCINRFFFCFRNDNNILIKARSYYIQHFVFTNRWIILTLNEVLFVSSVLTYLSTVANEL